MRGECCCKIWAWCQLNSMRYEGFDWILAWLAYRYEIGCNRLTSRISFMDDPDLGHFGMSVQNSDVPARAWPESPGFGLALGGLGLRKS